MKWIIVIGIGIAIVVIASTGRIPGTERQLALSEDTRTAAAIAHTPTYTRIEAIGFVERHIRENCAAADKYLPNIAGFEATWMRNPRTDDHHERRDREWTVTDPATSAMWRLYEDDLEVIDVLGDCKTTEQ